MGGKSKKQTVGYKYYLGMHLGLCHGPIDAITRLRVDDRDAWLGTNTGGSINVNKTDLFGGEKREGGVSGTIDVDMGFPTQGKNSYLVSKLGALIPAYRGIVGLIFRQCYLGNNPYLKTWSARGQRVYVRQDGIEQWYSSRAGVTSFGGVSSVALPVTLSWWQSSFHPGNNDYARMRITFHDNAGNEIGSATSPMIGTPNLVWTQRTIETTQPAGTAYVTLYMEMQRIEGSNNDGYIDDITLVVGGINVPVYNAGAEAGLDGWTASIGGLDIRTDTPAPHSGSAYFTGGGNANTTAYQQVGIGQLDMNAAHIVRECLTDPDWGMGYTEDDVDDDTFMSAADTFYGEKLGVSLLWDKSKTIEDFVATVQQHVDCALYVSRSTGKFVIKAIRGDYDEDALLHLDESNIIDVSDPTRVTFGELTNSVTVNYWDSQTGKDGSVTVNDTALVQQQGAVINSPVQYPGFTNARNATIAAQRDLRALSSPLLSCTITADSDAKVLNIADVFKFSWARWGLVEVVMRVTGISYGTGRNNRVKITCTQDVFDTDTSVSIVVPTPGWEDPSAPPSAVPEQMATEAPYYELVQALGQADIDNKLLTHPEVGYVIAAGGRPASAINASLFTDNGTGYEDVGALDFAPYGYVQSDITKTQTLFVVEDGVDLSEVVVGSHVQVGDELMRVDSLLVDSGAIQVGRGVLDTVPAEHAAGTPVFFWDAYAGFDPTEYVDGETVDAKIVPVSGAGVLPIDEAEALPVELASRAARPYAPGDLRLNGESYEADAFYEGEVAITWAHRDRLQQTAGVLIDHTAGDIGPEAGTLYRVQGYVDDVLVHTEDDIDGTSAVWTPEETGRCRVEVHAKRDGLYSWQAPSHTFLNANFRLTEANDERYTEDGDVRSIED